MKITTGLTTFYDETMVHFGVGVPTVDPNDVPKFGMGGGIAPGIASVSADGADLTFNAHGPVGGDITVPIKVYGGITGTYTITIHEVLGLFGGSCITLEDQASQTFVAVTQGLSYTCTLGPSDPMDPPRFLVHMTAPLEATALDAVCSTATDGSISVPITGTGPWNVAWLDGQGNPVVQQTVNAGPIVLVGQLPGAYTASVVHSNGCVQEVSATIGAGPDPVAAFSPSAIQADVNEVISFTNTSTPGTVASWDFGDGSNSSHAEPVHQYSDPGLYTVSLTASLSDCHAEATSLIEVQAATGIAEEQAINVAVFIQPDRIMITWPEADQALSAELFSASGRSVAPTQRSLNSNSPMYISTIGLPPGGYVLRVWNSAAMRSYMVPLAR
ncbi:MAG: PKD domain-containing protein [Flavobacteriales bacterium]